MAGDTGTSGSGSTFNQAGANPTLFGGTTGYGVFSGGTSGAGISNTGLYNQGGFLSPGVTQSSPTAAAYQQANQAQQASLSQVSSLINSYLNPNGDNNQLSNLNASTNAVGANNTLQSGIAGINSMYDPNSTFNQQVAQDYATAQKNYATITPQQAAAGQNGITNISQLYGNAEAQFQPYQQLGTSAAGALETMQGIGAGGAAAQQTAINNLMNSSYVQSQLALGEQGVAQQAGAAGMNRSGSTMQALLAYGQNLANNTIQQQITNLTNDVSIGNSATQSVAGLTNQQNAAEMSRAGALSTLQTAPITTQLQENAQALQGYGIQQQSQSVLDQYMNNYENTYNNANQAYVTAQSNVLNAQGASNAQAILGASAQPRLVSLTPKYDAAMRNYFAATPNGSTGNAGDTYLNQAMMLQGT